MSKRSKKKRRYVPSFDHPADSCRQPYEGEILVAGQKVNVYVLEHIDEIRFGMAKSFDRWANSSDFRAKMPQTEKQYERILERLASEIEAGNYDTGLAKEVWL